MSPDDMGSRSITTAAETASITEQAFGRVPGRSQRVARIARLIEASHISSLSISVSSTAHRRTSWIPLSRRTKRQREDLSAPADPARSRDPTHAAPPVPPQ